jgi:group I intron endonuclease
MDTYRATNTLNGKFYIGSSLNFEKRKQQHLKDRRVHTPFTNALRKNPEAFEWEVWTDDSVEPVLEQALLDMFFGTEQCYNLNPIASRPPSHKGKNRSAEFKAKVSESHTGKKRSPEHCESMSKVRKGKPPAWALPDGTLPREVVEKRAAARVANGKKWTKEQKEHASRIHALAEEEVYRRISLIKEYGLDPQKRGFVSKVADLLGFTRQYAGQFLKKYWSKTE